MKYFGGQINLIYFRIKIQSSQSFVLWSIPSVCFGYAIKMFKRTERKWKFMPLYFNAENNIMVKELSIWCWRNWFCIWIKSELNISADKLVISTKILWIEFAWLFFANVLFVKRANVKFIVAFTCQGLKYREKSRMRSLAWKPLWS